MKLKILAIGRRPCSWFVEAEADYWQRLAPFAKCELTLVSPEDENKLGVEKASQKEGEKLLAKTPTGWWVVTCDRGGQELDSEKLAQQLGKWRDNGEKVCFVIGGSAGLSAAVLDRADFKISFSKLTFPHELFRVILLEQLYRGFMILAGRKYHK